MTRSIPVGDSALRRVWPGEALFLLSQATWGIALVGAMLADPARPARFLVPDYYCAAALEPLRRTGISLVFYPVTASLDPDWAACEQLAGDGAVLLIADYFGHAADTPSARRFCDRHGMLLLEDAAHSLVPTRTIGRLADLTIYSPRKFLGLDTGGLLAVRDGALAARLAAVAESLPAARQPCLARALSRAFTSAWRRLRPRRARPLSSDAHAADPPDPAMFASPWMSRCAERSLRRQVADGQVARLAARLAGGHAELAARYPGAAIAADPADCPCLTVLRHDGPASASQRQDGLRQAGHAAFGWPRLPVEALDGAEHAMARHLRATLVAVPLGGRGATA